MSDELAFVQFPHPGSEHQPAGREMEWNRDQHARKFLAARGQYLIDGGLKTGPLAFWGEWEPQSRVNQRFGGSPPGGPRYLHEPFWRTPTDGRPRQNTDPLVFGDGFLYSNCRQQRNARLRRLAPGSLILFGSHLSGAFVLDTVLVVAEGSEEYFVADSARISCAPAAQATVFGSLRTDRRLDSVMFRLYRGRTYAERPEGPFSFVPCVPYDHEAQGFPRPRIDLDEKWLNPRLAMAAKVTSASSGQLHGLWRDITRQVVERGLALGVHMDMPGRD